MKDNGGSLKVIWCTFDDTPEEISRRVEDRLSRGAVGGCRSVDHYLADKARYEGTDVRHLVVNTSGDSDRAVQDVLRYLDSGLSSD